MDRRILASVRDRVTMPRRVQAGLPGGGLRPLTDPEGQVHVELAVHALLPWPEVGGRLRRRDDLGPVD